MTWNIFIFMHKYLPIPRGCSQGSDECLQQACNEQKWVLPGDHKVERWQDKDGVDEQASNDRHCVHAQLATHAGNVVHFYNFTRNQEQDTNRSIPED